MVTPASAVVGPAYAKSTAWSASVDAPVPALSAGAALANSAGLADAPLERTRRAAGDAGAEVDEAAGPATRADDAAARP